MQRPTWPRACRAMAMLWLTACAADRTATPVAARVPDAHAGSNVFPAFQYRHKLLFPATIYSVATAINDNNEVAGLAGNDPFFRDAAGNITLLSRNGGSWGMATDITAGGAVGGILTLGSTSYPAVWTSPTATPVTASVPGNVLAINDRLEAVGSAARRGGWAPIYWDVRSNTLLALPVPPGTISATANDINNDRVIVGEADGRGVMWRWNGSGFSYTLLSGIVPWAIDYGLGTAGRTLGGQAAWGKPSLAATWPTTGSARAWRVNTWGVAVGDDYTAATGTMRAWVGDRTGAFTILPAGTASQATARAVNTCGLVVGQVGNQAVTWDPGC